MAQRFAQNTANQQAQTQRLDQLRSDTLANNRELERIYEGLAADNKGEMMTAHSNLAREIIDVCRKNDTELEGMIENLQLGIKLVAAQESEGASFFNKGIM
jgi:hypothetical protein